jgi:hypothetical protein
VGHEFVGSQWQSNLEAGWPEFAISHNLKIGYFCFFKKLNAKEYEVVVLDYSC